MKITTGQQRARQRKRAAPMLGLLCGPGIAGCFAPPPARRDDGTAVISGHDTAGYSASNAVRRTLLQAARVTVDHGFRYFQIVDSRRQYAGYSDRASSPGLGNSWAVGGASLINPGVDVTIRAFRSGEISTRGAGIWDAQEILT